MLILSAKQVAGTGQTISLTRGKPDRFSGPVKGRTGRPRRRRLAYLFSLGSLTVAAVLAISLLQGSALGRFSTLVFDTYQQLRPRPQGDTPVIIVDIDEASIRSHGQWPWPRSDIAAIVDRLTELGAAAIGFDILFAEPDRTSVKRAAKALVEVGARVELPPNLPDNDELLAAAFARSQVVVGFVLSDEATGQLPPSKAGFAFAGANPGEYLVGFQGAVPNLSALTDAAAGAGFFSFPSGADGLVRTLPLVARYRESLFPQLAIETLRVALGASTFVIRATGASGEVDTGAAAMTKLKVGDVEVPTESDGSFRLYYSGMPDLRRISAARLLAPNADDLADLVMGRIVLVGSSSPGLRDLVATPISPAYAGVSVHAELIDQVLTGAFLTRPDWALGAEIGAGILLAFVLMLALMLAGPLMGALTAILLAGTAVGASWLFFSHGQMIIDPVLPAVSVLAVYTTGTIVLLILVDRERQFVRRAFSQYLSPALVERLAENPATLILGGETRELTILFSDIRGFTALSESVDPQSLTRILNGYLTPMSEVLLRAGATIDKYIGDGIMAFWNAPLLEPDHARSACLAALDMLGALGKINRRHHVQLKIGIGLNTGFCCVGNLGSEQRFSYSAVGDPVNVASRVEGLTKGYGVPILLTENTARHCTDLALLEVDHAFIRGRSEPMTLYALVGDAEFARTDGFRAWREAHRLTNQALKEGTRKEVLSALAEARGRSIGDTSMLYDCYECRVPPIA